LFVLGREGGEGIIKSLPFSYSRNVFGMDETSATTLEKYVEYVRKELMNLDKTPNIVIHGKVDWGPPPLIQ
jgi:hypothetical protein